MSTSTDQHPLGTPGGTDTTAVPDLTPSIVDTILNLDDFLSGDVRLAERSALFALRPDLEARIEELDTELFGLTDSRGNVLGTGEVDAEATVSTGTGTQRAFEVARELLAVQQEYARSFVSVRMRQMDSDAWPALKKKHERAIETMRTEKTFGKDLADALILACAIRPIFTPEQLAAFRKRVGDPVMQTLAGTAWGVCESSGVSVPKSQLSSLVLKRQEHAAN
ncbi:hypothetical protein [Nocardioides sp. AX2bis]|uniref:hypothetical protein n=1 Tax=Nocardioides sp. AX2bis TaxID=2653157 RepID=UPI0012F2149C|nr:hypothetical protein [Nocardioides sp. AX2bis]VXC44082.1 conserved hypothetical protein [Nocardioides sp. AX2bis]